MTISSTARSSQDCHPDPVRSMGVQCWLQPAVVSGIAAQSTRGPSPSPALPVALLHKHCQGASRSMENTDIDPSCQTANSRLCRYPGREALIATFPPHDCFSSLFSYLQSSSIRFLMSQLRKEDKNKQAHKKPHLYIGNSNASYGKLKPRERDSFWDFPILSCSWLSKDIP